MSMTLSLPAKRLPPPGMSGQTLTQFVMGSRLSVSRAWVGDLAHVYLNVDETLDLSAPANRAVFASNGAPANLDVDGSLVTGTALAFYFDGPVPAWGNQGSAGSYPLGGLLTASGTPQY